MDEAKERWIMASDGTPQMIYVGKTTLTDEEINEARMNGEYITLAECRVMRTIIIPAPDGVNQSNMLMPNSIARRGMTTRIVPNAYFWPDECDSTLEVLLDQIKKCESAEIKHRAKQAGLVTPDGMRSMS